MQCTNVQLYTTFVYDLIDEGSPGASEMAFIFILFNVFFLEYLHASSQHSVMVLGIGIITYN